MQHTIKNVLFMTIALAAGTGTAIAQDCTPKHKFPTIESGALTISVPVYAPFSTLEADGTIGGVDGEILKEFAKRECLKINAIPTDPAASVQYVVTGKSDITMGDWMRTPSRDKVLGLSAPLYIDPMGIVTKDGANTIDQLVGRKIGTVQGYNWNTELGKILGDDLKVYPNSVALSRDLEAGRIDGGTDGYANMVFSQSQGGLRGLKVTIAKPDERVAFTAQPGQAGFPYTKGNSEFGAALDATITALHEDGSIVSFLGKYNIDKAAADVGEPRLTGN